MWNSSCDDSNYIGKQHSNNVIHDLSKHAETQQLLAFCANRFRWGNSTQFDLAQ